MKKFGYIKFLSAVFLLVSIISCTDKKEQTGSMPPPLVSVAVIEKRNIPVSAKYVGLTEGSKAVEVRAQVSGILMSQNYIDGDYVEAGQLLFQIDPATYKANLANAEGQLAQADAARMQARQNYDRIKYLYAKNALSQMDYDNAKGSYDTAIAQVKSAGAAVEDAKIMLGYTSVVSPISGYSSKAQVSVGNLISGQSSSSNLLTVVNQANPIWVNFFIPDPDFARMRQLTAENRLKVGESYGEIFFADGTPFSGTGKLIFVDKMVNRTTADINARLEFANDNLTIMPGQFVNIILKGSTLIGAMMIPQQALIQAQNSAMVIVVDNNSVAQYRPVKVSDNMGEFYLLDEGLQSGERIIVEGTNKVRPGQKVRLTPPSSGM